MELSVKGKAIPGKSLAMNAKVTPGNATDKNLTWALDVDESIATISAKGQIKISKEAPAGTAITVTCTAEGAPEPVVATAEIVVVEK